MYNNCQGTIYSFTITPEGLMSASNGIAPGKWYKEPYQYPSVGGVSIKLSGSDSDSNDVPITQLEYCFNQTIIWYDLSNVNCGPTSQTAKGMCPFLYGGMYLEVDQVDCPTRTCESQDLLCPQAYNFPDEDWVVRQCDYNGNDLVMYFCSSIPVC
jgi:hypothetical protein